MTKHPLMLGCMLLASVSAGIPNGGFEMGVEDWDASKDPGMSTVNPDSARSGNGGLRVVDGDPKGGSSLISRKVPAEAGRPFTLGFWGRFVSGKGSLAVYLRFYDDLGVQLNPYPKFTHIVELREGAAWKRYEKTFQSPAGTKYVDVWIHSYDSAVLVADIDDLEVGSPETNIPAGTIAAAPQKSAATEVSVPSGEKWLTMERIGKFPQKKVASSDATAAEKASADFVCEGVGDEVKINEAASQAKLVELVGPTFTIGSPVKLKDNVLLGAGSGRTTIRMVGNVETGIYIRGGKTLLGETVRLEKGATSFSWTASTPGSVPKPGDYLLIHSDDWFTGTRGYYWRGEVARAVLASAQEITLERIDDRPSVPGGPKGLWDNYTAKPKVYRLDLLPDVGIQGLRILGPEGVRHRVIRGEFLLRPFFRDVKIDGQDACHEGLSLNPVVDVLVEDCDIRNVADSKSTTFATGYA